MRAYFFVNSALSGIQKGLQVAHCAVEIGLKATLTSDDFPELSRQYRRWRQDHKTIVVLEGGFHADLKKICELFLHGVEGKRPGANPSDFPWAHFSEDEETMNGMMTAVGIILPERIYEAARVLREKRVDMERWVKIDLIDPYHQHFSRKVQLEKLEEFTEWEAELIKLINSCPLAR